LTGWHTANTAILTPATISPVSTTRTRSRRLDPAWFRASGTAHSAAATEKGLETERRDCDDALRASEASRAQRGLRGGRA
jgi:hypothetical protein